MKYLINIIVAGIGLINISMFVYLKKLIQFAEMPNDMKYVYDSLSFNFTILEIILVLISLAIGILGFIGFQAIKEAAINAARKSAEEDFKRFHAQNIQQSSAPDDFRPSKPNRIEPGDDVQQVVIEPRTKTGED